MRLIDADALIESIENIKLYNITPGQPPFDMNRVRADELIKTINEQPTAYDMKKVEQQVKDYFFDVIDNCEEEKVQLEILKYNKAVCKIVRKGGESRWQN